MSIFNKKKKKENTITDIEKEILTKTIDLEKDDQSSHLKSDNSLEAWSNSGKEDIGDLKRFVRQKVPLSSDETIEFKVIKKKLESDNKKHHRKKIDKKYAKALELANVERFFPDVEQGLNTDQVEKRIKQGYVNKTRDTYTKSVGKIVADNIFTFFNILMFCIAVILIIYKSYTDLFFLVIVVVNLVIGIVQEIRAKKVIDKLKLVTSPSTIVIRNGQKINISSQDVVLDDIYQLKNGDQIPTDAVVLSGMAEVNESLLTGESKPIKKVKNAKILAGSYVVSGIVTVQATSVGENTFAGNLQAQAKKYRKSDSQLANSINKIIKVVSVFIVPIAIAMGYSNYTSALTMVGTQQEAITLAVQKTAGSIVGMIPSGLILLTSVALFTSVIRLARRKTYVQDLYSIERLARVNCLCLDKTGTLTDGTMKVERTIKIKPRTKVEEILPNFLGAFQSANQTSLALQNEFSIKHDYLVKRILPFSSTRKISAVQFENKGTYVLGAPEYIYDYYDDDLNALITINQQKGYRVLMFARASSGIKNDNIDGKFDPVAIFIIEDHIRENAKKTIEWFINNDVEINVISGDSPVTVSEIAKKCGVPNADKYVSLEGLSLSEVDSIANKYSVFGRVTPEQKAQLIQSFKNQEKIVAMTGDGVNDILAMKKSDCAIAMANGTESTKAVAHAVLLDSNFASMPSIVGEGRRVINNIQLSASLFLMKTVFTILLSITVLLLNVFGIDMTYPFSPSNLMIMEIFIIGLPAAVLALQPNLNRVKGGFMTNVLLKSLPGAFCLFIVVMVCYILGTTGFFGISIEYDTISYLTVSTLVMYFSALTVLYDVCLPFNVFRTFVFIISVILTIVFTVFTPRVLTGLDVYSMNKIQWLVFLVLGFVSPTILVIVANVIRLFRKAYVTQNKDKNKDLTEEYNNFHK